MAKTSMINREVKRTKLAKQYAVKRDALKKIICSQDASYEDKMDRSSCRSSRVIRRRAARPRAA
jgi:small subunit ribosomal protein S14